MRRVQGWSGLAALLLLAVLAPGAAAHGGQYTAPGAPAQAGGARGPSGAGGGAVGSGAPSSTGFAPATITGWESWWEHNKHALLLKRQRSRDGLLTVADRSYAGRGRHDGPGAGRRADRAQVLKDVLPALRALLGRADDPDILDSAVLALARSASEGEAQDVLADAERLLASRVTSVQAAAALALGVLDSPRALPDLRALLADGKEGHDLTGRRGVVPAAVRAFAALSLGLVNDPGDVAILADLIERTPDRERDVKACAIVALGLMDNARSDEASRVLSRLLDDGGLDAVLAAQVPTALARLASRPQAFDPSALPALVHAFTRKGTDVPVRQSLALALGRVGDVTAATVDADGTVSALAAALAHDGDLGTRQFSLMALARIGARDAAADAHAAVHAALQALLERGLDDPSQPALRSWFALASAVYADGQPAARAGLLLRIGRVYELERDPAVKSACALAFGLLGDMGHGDRLQQDFRQLDDDEFRGCAGLALGLMGRDEAADELRAACRDPALSPTARSRIAQGLGLLRDARVSEVLVATLKGSRSQPVCAGLAASLGLVGEPAALEPLRLIAADESAVTITRAFACVALGMLCEKTELPWNARLTEDCNYLALVPSLAQALDIL